MTRQEYLDLCVGDVCEINHPKDYDYGRLVKVRYIEDGCVVVKPFDKEEFDRSSHKTLRIINWRSLRIVLKAVKESE